MNRFFTALVVSLALCFPAFADAPVDINHVDATALAAALTGVGQAKAEAIVAHRDQHGPFRSAEDLAAVRGIGMATVERNRARILVNGKGQAAQLAQRE